MSEDPTHALPAKAGRRAPVVAAVRDPIETLEAATEAAADVAETAETVAATAAVTPIVETESVAETVETMAADTVETAAEIVEAAPTPGVIVSPGAALATKAAQRLKALSAANTVLTRGVQEASRTWVSAAEDGLKLQREGFKRLTACRTPLDLVSAQGDLALRSLEAILATGQSIIRTSTHAAGEAGEALQG